MLGRQRQANSKLAAARKAAGLQVLADWNRAALGDGRDGGLVAMAEAESWGAPWQTHLAASGRKASTVQVLVWAPKALWSVVCAVLTG